MKFSETKYQNIVVLGAGESGLGAALLAHKMGKEVFVSDVGKIAEANKQQLKSHHLKFEEGEHSLERILQAELLIKSPGIPDQAPVVLAARSKGIPVISEIEFASWFSQAFIIGITGTNGKTTTTALTGHILQHAGFDVCVAGNIGKSFAAALAEADHEYFVLELSSFQLDGIVDFRPDIAVLLNITPDHLDRYGNCFEAYAVSKWRITKNLTEKDAFIYNADDDVINKLLINNNIKTRKFPISIQKSFTTEGAFLAKESINIKINKQDFNMTLEQLALQGKHNTYNSMAAGVATKLLDIRKETLKQSLSDFQNIAHRIEFVANVHGIAYYNDSKATSVNATWYALESMDRPVVWIVGGLDKGNDYNSLVPLVKQKVKAIICLGADNSKLKKFFGELIEPLIETTSVDQAVMAAAMIASKGDVVLLSPACASFDLFKNYEERGDLFKNAVKAL
ncbi:MAG: UDP-N-acetylmuramoyl-L-alanine--D-glutamate ligase [Bacteroidales bacterium]|nr:UDP-N-acetylmuramoyl-L-alanine--D-glutamate ligase [Bacteroidales bacterium]HOI32166.1 UDP-N-acetylmuramoyl-L-alanine--D-glutamate ligase [Bacteroidales bacterium]